MIHFDCLTAKSESFLFLNQLITLINEQSEALVSHYATVCGLKDTGINVIYNVALNAMLSCEMKVHTWQTSERK